MNVLKEATVTEIGNIVINGVLGSITNMLQKQLNYSVPTYMETTLGQLLDLDNAQDSDFILWAQTKCTIAEFNTAGDILLMFGVRDLKLLQTALDALLGTQKSSHALA